MNAKVIENGTLLGFLLNKLHHYFNLPKSIQPRTKTRDRNFIKLLPKFLNTAVSQHSASVGDFIMNR